MTPDAFKLRRYVSEIRVQEEVLAQPVLAQPVLAQPGPPSDCISPSWLGSHEGA